jgi:enoyl-CoA hydratase
MTDQYCIEGVGRSLDTTSLDVRIASAGAAGMVALNRPRARNALTLDMVRTIADAMRRLSQKSELSRLVISSDVAGVFCAGGDIRAIRDLVLQDRVEDAMVFFREEFALNLALAEAPHDVVALIDGICMGGGCGLSLHGRYRVVTENAVLAMPETAIGYVPDVGASHFLSRLADGIGLYLALTGARVGAGDACALGLATHFVPAEHLADLMTSLADDAGETGGILARFSAPIDPGPLWAQRQEIASIFSGWNIGDIVRRLERSGEGATIGLSGLQDKSPNSLRETIRLIQAAAGRNLAECLKNELEAVGRIIAFPDFVEGVRAVLVDRDRTPRWSSSFA